jgi:nucleoside-diphosphate-sugar epimerase
VRVLVAGLGDVGGRAASILVAHGHEVIGVRRSSTDGPTGVTMVQGDLTDSTLADRLTDDIDAVLITVSSDGRDPALYRSAYVEGPTALLAGLARRGDRVGRVVFTSSSAVYGQQDGAWVDESSPTDPASPTAKVLVEAEQLLANGPFPVTTLRLTGIYGPGRTRLIDLVRRGDAVVGSTPSFTNRIHAADAADACVLLLELGDAAPPVVVGTDDEPADRVEVYRWLATELGVAGPTVDDERAPGRGSKRCRNDLLRSLGWVPQYPTFREGYAELLA